MEKHLTIVVRCLYDKPITPNFRIFYLSMKNWRKWLWGDNSERIRIYKEIADTAINIREIAWIPLFDIPEEKRQELISFLINE